jgi:hypothetical protein
VGGVAAWASARPNLCAIKSVVFCDIFDGQIRASASVQECRPSWHGVPQKVLEAADAGIDAACRPVVQ